MNVKDALKSWHWLQEGLRDCDEKFAVRLLQAEQNGLNRTGFVLRIHSRINRLRRARERRELA